MEKKIKDANLDLISPAFPGGSESGSEGSCGFSLGDRAMLPDKVGHEVMLLGKIEEFMKDGEDFIAFLYSSRNCSKTLHSIDGTENASLKAEISLNALKILLPSIHKLTKLHKFTNNLVKFITEDVLFYLINTSGGDLSSDSNKISSNSSSFLSDQNPDQTRSFTTKTSSTNNCLQNSKLVDKLLHLIDLVVRLDTFKDMNSSILNDYSAFKRSIALCKNKLTCSDLTLQNGEIFSGLEPGELSYESLISKEIYKLQMFLADPICPKNICINMLKNCIFKYGDLQKSSKEVDFIIHFLTHIFSYAKNYVSHQVFFDPMDKFRILRTLPYIMLLMDCNSQLNLNQQVTDDKNFNVFKNKVIFDSNLKKIFFKYPLIPCGFDMSVQVSLVLKLFPHFESRYEVFDFELSSVETMKSLKSGFDLNVLKRTYMVSENIQDIEGKHVDLVGKVENYEENTAKGTKLVLEVISNLCLWKEIVILQNLNIELCDSNDLLRIVRCIKSLKNLMMKNISKFKKAVSEFMSVEIEGFFVTKLPKIISEIDKGVDVNKTFTLKKPKNSLLSLLLKLQTLNKFKPIDENWLNMLVLFGHNILQQNANIPISKFATLTRAKKSKLKNDSVMNLTKFFNRLELFQHIINLERCVHEVSNLSVLYFGETFQNQADIVSTICSLASDSMDISMVYCLDIYNDIGHVAISYFRREYILSEVEAKCVYTMKKLLADVAKNIYTLEKYSAVKELLKNLDRDYYKTQSVNNRELPTDKINFSAVEDFSNVSSDNLIELKSRVEMIANVAPFKLLGKSFSLKRILKDLVEFQLRKDMLSVQNRFKQAHISQFVNMQYEIEILQHLHGSLNDILSFDEFRSYIPDLQEIFTNKYIFTKYRLDFIASSLEYEDTHDNVEFLSKNMTSSEKLSHSLQQFIKQETRLTQTSFDSLILYNYNSSYNYSYLDISLLAQNIISSSVFVFHNKFVPNYIDLSHTVKNFKLNLPRKDSGIDYAVLALRTQCERLILNQHAIREICVALEFIGNAFAAVHMLGKSLKADLDFFEKNFVLMCKRIVECLNGFTLGKEVKMMNIDELWDGLKYLSVFFEEMSENGEVQEMDMFGDGVIVGGTVFQYILNQGDQKEERIVEFLLRLNREGQDGPIEVIEKLKKVDEVERSVVSILQKLDFFDRDCESPVEKLLTKDPSFLIEAEDDDLIDDFQV